MALRPGSSSAKRMWDNAESADDKEWIEALSSYGLCIAAVSDKTKPTKGLSKVDQWWTSTLPSLLREEQSISKASLVKVMQWKLGRGKFRPLMGRLESGNTPAQVIACSQRAFCSAKSKDSSSVKNAVIALTQLVAVGPATASAVLAAYDPSWQMRRLMRFLLSVPGRIHWRSISH
eukprot:m.677040 g.677040  ORF g.677040 m.677040 type:complete len:176 (-) comp22793_c0_seq8:2139-2666(-)